jgi:hypothetical protein
MDKVEALKVEHRGRERYRVNPVEEGGKIL